MRAAGVGNWDNLVRAGQWNVGAKPPMALGVQAAGVVTKIGPMVSRVAPGDGVLVHSSPLEFQGSWATQFVALEHDVGRKPESMDWSIAGAFPVPGLTAWQVVRDVGVAAGDRVMVNGGGGITGSLIVAAAGIVGAEVLATASPQSARELLSTGASACVDYHDPGWHEAAKRFAPRGYSVVINAARGRAESVLDLVTDGGNLATITGDPPRAERAITVLDFYVTPNGALLEAAASEVVTRRISLSIARSGGLGSAAEFLSAAASGRAGGAQVLLPAE